jgi:hypothetical protein
MLSQTASMVYYNRETETFDLAGVGTGFEYSHAKSVTGLGFLNVAGIKDARLFGPFGNNIVSGSDALGKSLTLPDLYVANDVITKLASNISYSGTLLNSKFSAAEKNGKFLDGEPVIHCLATKSLVPCG